MASINDADRTGESLVRIIENAFAYTTPQRAPAFSTATAGYHPAIQPLLDCLPAFIVRVDDLEKLLVTSLAQTLNKDLADGTIDYDAVISRCSLHLNDKTEGEHFGRREVGTEGSVSHVGVMIAEEVQVFVRKIYQRLVDCDEQHRLIDQVPDRLVIIDDSHRIDWEDKAPMVLEKHGKEIVALAASDKGKQLVFNGAEEHGRAIIYKIGTAAHHYKLHWGVLFGGDGVILFQRVQSTLEPTRYGLLCSGMLGIERMFIFVLAMLLVPGNEPLVDVATLEISVPDEAWAGDNPMFTRAVSKTLKSRPAGADEGV